MTWRYLLSTGIEAAIWAATLVWQLFLVTEVWRAFDLRGEFDVRSAGEFVLLALLVYWPILRTRIRYGYWLKSWDDSPGSRFYGEQHPSGDRPALRDVTEPDQPTHPHRHLPG